MIFTVGSVVRYNIRDWAGPTGSGKEVSNIGILG